MLRTSLSAAFGLAVFCCGPLLAQVQPDWRQTYSTTALPPGSLDSVTALALASNGDVIWASDHAFLDPVTHMWQRRTELHRTSAAGTPLWTISPAPNADVRYFDVHFDPAGDVYFSGRVGLSQGNPDPLVTKVSATGTFLWSRQVNGPANDYDVGFGSLGPAGTFSFVGMLDLFNNVFVRSYDANGNVLSHGTQSAAAAGLFDMVAARRLPGGDFVAVGEGAGGLSVARIAASGAMVWNTLLPFSSPQDWGRFLTLEVGPNGNIAAAGYLVDPLANTRVVLRVVNSAGSVLLDHVGPLQPYAVAQSVAFNPDGSLWLLANERVTTNAPNELTVRRFTSGLALGPGLSLPYAGAVAFSSYPVVGESGQLWVIQGGETLLELAPSATLNWSVPLVVPGSFDSQFMLALGPDRHFVAAGYRDASAGAFTDTDALLARFDASEMPQGYCVGMPGALGCAPRLTFEGSPRAGAASGFTVRAAPWTSQLAGNFLVGTGGAVANPFHGGTLCVGVPRVRTTALFSGGNPLGADCSGSLALDYGAFASGALRGTLLPGLHLAGTQVRLQAWSRDPGSATNTLLSNALEFTVLP
ncbi:MAG: hypothetical protein NTV21_14165 [Planctomycetota bacterium]|nr:hypothetical protein [Planctomycetota bacterium]